MFLAFSLPLRTQSHMISVNWSFISNSPGARVWRRRDTFVTELFDGSPSAYHRTLDRIDRSANYTEATGIISSDILRAHSVNPYTESMVAFIDAVQDHFDRR